MKLTARFVLLILCVLATTSFSGASSRPQYGDLALQFEANVGQTDEQVKFLARGRGYTLFLTHAGPVLSLFGPTSAHPALRMNMLGASRSPRIEGLDPLPGKSNYFVGNDPRRWRKDIATFSRVRYRDVYPGIDVIYYGKQGQLEYDIQVGPGAHPNAIRIAFEGVEKLALDFGGDLLLSLPGGVVRQHKPNVYQWINGARKQINVRYALGPGRTVRFQLAPYDPSRPLIIDPVLSYSSYLGGIGGGNELGRAIAIDSAGNAYVTGETDSPNLPSTSAAAQRAYAGGGRDAFVAKLNPAGTAIVYLTYLGGNDSDYGYGIAVDPAGNAYITGYTNSSNFPTSRGAFQTTFRGTATAFVTKLDPSGSTLVYSTYLGGSGADVGYAIAVDAAGAAVVTGYTRSSNFPTTNGAFQPWSPGPGYDAFLTKLNPAGAGIVYSTYLGGAGSDVGASIALDAAGSAYVAGYTASSDFPVTAGAAQTVYGGGYDFFVTKFSPTASSVVYSSYLGGSKNDYGQAVRLDGSGSAYVVGYTESANFPTTPGVFQSVFGGGWDAAVAKLNASGTALLYSTYLGGAATDYGYSLAVDSAGNAYVGGYSAGGFPTTPGSFSPDNWGAVVAKLSPAAASLAYSTYLASSSGAYAVAVDSGGRAVLTGYTSLAVFPTTSGAVQTAFGGNTDAFVTRLNAAGSALEYSTFLGRAGGDAGYGVGADGLGNTYVVGDTGSLNFPVSLGSYQASLRGSRDIFITKLNAAGNAVVYSTYLGGSADDNRARATVGPAGNVFVTGGTFSADFPVTPGAFQSVLRSADDAFVAKLNAAGNGLAYSTYLGGNGGDVGSGIAVDSSDSAYVTGWTWSSNFPATPGALAMASAGRADAFVTKLNPAGTALVYSTYLGGSGTDVGETLAVDSAGNAYVAGSTVSLDLPVTPGAFQPSHGGGPPELPHAPFGRDAYVAKVNAFGSALAYLTYLGGDGSEQIYALGVDSAGSAYVTGYTTSSNFPTTPGSLQTVRGGPQDAFLTKLLPSGTGVAYSTYLGGGNYEYAFGIAIDGSGNACLAGQTTSGDFPTTAGALQRGLAGGFYTDAFITKFNATGNALLYSTYFGGTNSDSGRGIALDAAGNMYVTGFTYSTDLPTTGGAVQPAYGGLAGADAFVLKIAAADGPCVYSASPGSDSFRSGGGGGTVTVNTPAGCNWIASSHAFWITINTRSGSGSGAVKYRVAENSSTTARTGTATIAGQMFTVNQAGATCAYSLSARQESFPAEGGLGMVDVSAPLGCAWTAASDAGWVTIRSGESGDGKYTVRYTVAPNTAKNPRRATITVAGQDFSVRQEGSR